MTVFFNCAERAAVDAALRRRGLREHDVEIHEAQPVGHVGKLLGGEIGPACQIVLLDGRLREAAAGVAIGQRNLDRRDVRALDQPVIEFGQAVDDQAERHVDLLDQRVLGPAQEADQPRGLAAGQRIQIAGRDEVFGIGEEHGHALPRCRVDQVPLDQAVQQQEHGVGVAGPIAGLSPAGGKLLLHGPQPLGVASGLRPQPLAQVVAQHQVPAAEDLRGEELRQAAIRVLRAVRAADQVVHVAVQNEEAGRAGEIRSANSRAQAGHHAGRRFEQGFGRGLRHGEIQCEI